MPETRTTAIAVRPQLSRVAGMMQSSATFFERIGYWAGDTAQEFGSLVSALMGPAVFSAYALAVWSLAADLNWTNTFPFTSGPLSNWLIWFGIAILVNLAASILRKHTTPTEATKRKA
jgi:hypothetical protein